MRAKIDCVSYFNTSGGGLLCKTYINDGTSRQIHEITIATKARSIVVDGTAPHYLDAGYKVEGDAASATSVNFHVYGQLEQKGA
jgi:hypothetical protein